ncbi:PEP-utilizing family enzyme [Haloactinospora alba]|uniref:PEP-utilizing family enzyme n=2 Tax=Haloactinospora alba TaxID=405555 RepID=A0A543NIG4_9ACTN|nr:PEP-utilizing family enzyme [Haloactinospora alba]
MQMTGQRVLTRDGGGLVVTVGGRWYVNVSNMLWLGTERLAALLGVFDVHAARVMRNVDARRYVRAAGRPGVAPVARMVVGAAARLAGPVGRALEAVVAPERAWRRYEAAVEQQHQRVAGVVRSARSLPELGDGTLRHAVRLLVREGMPLTCAAEGATLLFRLLHLRASGERRQRLDVALSSMPHNVTVDMGLALYRLARSLEESVGRQAMADVPTLARRVGERNLPEVFLREWDAFMDSYGFRGPNELDLASPRYRDDPGIVLEQMRQYVELDEATQETPEQAHGRRQRQRREAYRGLLADTRNPLTAWLVRKLYRTAEAFSGCREIHKYQLVRVAYQVRRGALEAGRELVEHGWLDSAEQVFDLTYEDLRSVTEASGPDLRARAHDNTCYRRGIQRRPGAVFPVLVDSRGRVPRAVVRRAGPGVLVGEGVSAGVARGPAKVLGHVGEKPVLPGEVLVARATDPGWTPLFVNAAGVVLETGGSFQHGALVAREYGRPCVVGVEDADQRVLDGQMVEIDGVSGTVTVVPDLPDSGG